MSQRLQDIREAHRWATMELENAAPNSRRAWCLMEERKRLAGLHQLAKEGRLR